MPYPLPIAETPEIEKVRTLYRVRYGVNLSFDDAKRFLEGVMQFIYLTEVEPKLVPLQQWDQPLDQLQDAPTTEPSLRRPVRPQRLAKAPSFKDGGP